MYKKKTNKCKKKITQDFLMKKIITRTLNIKLLYIYHTHTYIYTHILNFLENLVQN